MSRPAPERGHPRAARHQLPEKPTRALHGKVLGGIWAGTGKRDSAVEGAPANPPGQNGQGQNELGGCVRVGLETRTSIGVSGRAGRGRGAVRQRLGDGDGGREANILLRKTKRRRACRRLGDGVGSPEANVLLREAKRRQACRLRGSKGSRRRWGD